MRLSASLARGLVRASRSPGLSASSFAQPSADPGLRWSSTSLGRAGQLDARRLLHSSLVRAAEETAAKDAAQTDAPAKDAQESSKAEAELAAEVESLRAANAELGEKAADMKDKYLRELARVDNLQKRNARELAQAKEYAIQTFAKDLLDVPDILHKAIAAVPQDELEGHKALKDLHQGLTMTEAVLFHCFERHGLAKIHPQIGEKFDPERHEALCQIPDPGETPGTVGQLLKTGYSLHSRTIRAAQVGVFKKP